MVYFPNFIFFVYKKWECDVISFLNRFYILRKFIVYNI